MNKLDTSYDETLRVHTLRELNILDTAPEDRFDRLTRLAKRMFNVPIALVSLIDSDRQWFKSSIGLPVSQTARSVSFCGHAILQNEAFVVPDASLDPRFATNPLVLGEPHIRFYAGQPLKLGNGIVLGTLCIIDSVPRSFSDEDREALRDLAKIVENELIAIHMAVEDELTGLPNRRGFLHQAQKTISLCYRLGKPAALIFFDLTRFKQINDQYGHDEGDRALKTFGRLLDNLTRESDTSARLAGDEFVLLMNDASAEAAKECVARLEKGVRDYNEHSGKPYDIRFNEGIVELDLQTDHSVQLLLKLADAMMYQQKRKRMD
ncbi:diguanylate cyclase with GAF sensor [Marinobacter sp. DSM 26671]|jgi:diguanylate cyclase (GGDEF)-like protein|uniref:sensor domain-containing diguanylate cyclase n=1 Tax=Marinobacter sp. DSM 26671 TaxID=1761793 RepID=UPI0008E681EC|nr:sensor domain-containing diguanylate cyclase [Marinobacter sp. DSM 26671]SFD95221.1 diguanylate cyclase with GAF sensor [Marinobacter sp. DSM 26671]